MGGGLNTGFCRGIEAPALTAKPCFPKLAPEPMKGTAGELPKESDLSTIKRVPENLQLLCSGHHRMRHLPKEGSGYQVLTR